jgi:general secretion pathway protein C
MPNLLHSTVSPKAWARGLTLVLCALATGSATYWVLRSLDGGAPASAAVAMVTQGPQQDPLAVARALGGGEVAPVAAEPALSSRFALVGVVADRTSSGAALISVDGQPAKPFRVGAPVEGQLVLKSVSPRQAQLATSLDSPALVRLDMPPLPQ